MTDDKLIDLWQLAQKSVIVKNPRAFEDLKLFAELVEDEIVTEYQDKPVIEPEDVAALMWKWFGWFFSFLGVVLVVSMVYAMLHFQPSKPVPDCGKCPVYKEGVKK